MNHIDTITDIFKALIERDSALTNFLAIYGVLVGSGITITQGIVIPLIKTKG